MLSEPIPSAPVAVVLVEDDRRLRESLSMLLGGTPGFACVAACGSVEEALRIAPRAMPDVVLLDIHLPGLRGSLGAAPIVERWPRSAVLMHTADEESDLVYESLVHGASGYVLKRTPPARLLEAIVEVHRGGAPMSPEIARKVISSFRRIAPPAEEVERLSPQEARLLSAIASGKSYNEAAKEIGVSINTVRTYIRSVYEKLHVHTRSEAVAKALRSGQI
ncbi:MAG: response regulator transcription factor [Thermoanaerobaculia bacterium]